MAKGKNMSRPAIIADAKCVGCTAYLTCHGTRSIG